MSKYKRSGRPQSSRRRRTTRPCLEALESRQLLLTPATILPLPTPSPAPFAGGGNTLAGAEIEGLYHIILGRPADPAGLANWDAQLKAGESVAQIAGQFFQSPEYLNNVVESYYQTYLGRAGDPAGVASWVAQLQAGASEQQVAAAFLASPEYSATHVTDGDFVQSLYENVLGRAGDQAGINNWTQALGAGTSRGAVAASFISSPESYQRTIDADYNAFLGRAGDTAGVNSWMAQVENGSLTLAEVAAQFAGSSEYATRASQEPSPATQLVVTTPPASVTANAPFGLTVTAENGSGIIDTTYTGPVTLALSGGTSGAVLGGTLTGTAVNGVATFSGLTINTAGTGYTLTASSGTLTSATSSINVTAPVTATQLVDTTTPPASVAANASFGLTVTAEDGSGNIATTYTGPVTLALSGGTSGAVLGGTVTGTAVKGVATFTGLTINMVGTGYTLTASSGTLTSATIPGINVASAPVTATQLVVTTQPPASVTANAPFGLTVTAEDGSGNIATTYTGPVTLVLSGGTSGAVLGGTLTATAVNGVATFSGLTINTAGTGYTLTASSGTLTSATSSINVTTTQLVVTTPPACLTPNTPFGLTVAVENGSGIIDTTYTGPVTLALSGGTSGAVLGGTLTATAVNGSATFSGLTINTVGTGYTLTASSGTLTSAPVTVTVATASPTEPTEIPVISFHGISTDPTVFPYDMPLSTFTADMTALHNAGYHSITLQQYLDWEAGKNPVLPSKPILLTDDDGEATISQMTSVLQSDGYTMVAFIITGFIDQGDTYYATWAQLQSMAASGTWEFAFHAGADGHYDYSTAPPPGQQIEPNAPDFYADYFTANNGGVLETDAQYEARVTTELDQGMAELKAKIPSAYTNVFAVPRNSYGEYAPDSPGGQQQQDLTTIFGSRFTIVFVEDNDYPNSVGSDHHQYRFEVHNDTTTSDLLAALNDPAFTRFGLPVALTATQLVVTTPPPASVTAGGTFSLTVTAEDDAGNVDTTYNGPVMLILNGSDATATLSGAPVGEDAGNIVDAINGVATFSNLTINTAGTGYTIDAFAVDLPGWAETDPITVT